jgi:hypothetical protein
MWIITGVLLGAISLATLVGFHAGPHAHVVMRLTTPRSSTGADVPSVSGDLGFIRRLKADTQRSTRAERHSLGSRATNV